MSLVLQGSCGRGSKRASRRNEARHGPRDGERQGHQPVDTQLRPPASWHSASSGTRRPCWSCANSRRQTRAHQPGLIKPTCRDRDEVAAGARLPHSRAPRPRGSRCRPHRAGALLQADTSVSPKHARTIARSGRTILVSSVTCEDQHPERALDPASDVRCSTSRLLTDVVLAYARNHAAERQIVRGHGNHNAGHFSREGAGII
jgi:hypothetical protein